jgi:hypothetical protein
MKTMITVHSYEDVDLVHLQACLDHIKRFEEAYTAEVFVSSRNSDGWLEYIIRYEFPSSSKLTVGAIQRKPGMPVEFHS